MGVFAVQKKEIFKVGKMWINSVHKPRRFLRDMFFVFASSERENRYDSHYFSRYVRHHFLIHSLYARLR
jgi:hypothetical protein